MKKPKKINGYSITIKSQPKRAGWMANNYGEAVMMAEFIRKSENLLLDDMIIEEKVYEF